MVIVPWVIHICDIAWVELAVRMASGPASTSTHGTQDIYVSRKSEEQRSQPRYTWSDFGKGKYAKMEWNESEIG